MKSVQNYEVSNLKTTLDKLKFYFKKIYSEDISNHPLIDQVFRFQVLETHLWDIAHAMWIFHMKDNPLSEVHVRTDILLHTQHEESYNISPIFWYVRPIDIQDGIWFV